MPIVTNTHEPRGQRVEADDSTVASGEGQRSISASGRLQPGVAQSGRDPLGILEPREAGQRRPKRLKRPRSRGDGSIGLLASVVRHDLTCRVPHVGCRDTLVLLELSRGVQRRLDKHRLAGGANQLAEQVEAGSRVEKRRRDDRESVEQQALRLGDATRPGQERRHSPEGARAVVIPGHVLRIGQRIVEKADWAS